MRSLIPLQFNFEGRYDMVRFFKLIQEHDMFAMVRLGPFIQAEWNHGSVRPTNYHSSVKYAHIDLIVLCFFYAIFSTFFQWSALLA